MRYLTLSAEAATGLANADCVSGRGPAVGRDGAGYGTRQALGPSQTKYARLKMCAPHVEMCTHGRASTWARAHANTNVRTHLMHRSTCKQMLNIYV